MYKLLIPILIINWLGLIFAHYNFRYSSYCQLCISACTEDRDKGYYWCQTYDWTFKDEVYTWDYCSPSGDLDYKGRNCSSVCAFHGEEYQWCTTGDTWGHCSGEFCTPSKIELPDYGFSTYCQSCITPCSQVKTDYYWCGTEKWIFDNKTWSWDYCSPNGGVDYLGHKCLNKCTFRGKNYQWCPTQDSKSKGYCTGKGSVLCNFL